MFIYINIILEQIGHPSDVKLRFIDVNFYLQQKGMCKNANSALGRFSGGTLASGQNTGVISPRITGDYVRNEGYKLVILYSAVHMQRKPKSIVIRKKHYSQGLAIEIIKDSK